MATSNDQGRKGNATNTKNTSPNGPGGKKAHTPRPMTSKFDLYRVPLDQAQNFAGTVGNNAAGQSNQQPQFQQYYHFEQKIQGPNTGQMIPQAVPQPVYYTVPYSKLQYNYEAYGHQTGPQQANGPQPGYPLPQVDPNYYYNPGHGSGPYTASPGYPKYPPPLTGNDSFTGLFPVKRGQTPVNYGHAPYASPWAAQEKPKSPFSQAAFPAPLLNKTNEKDEVMQKLEEMHIQMTKMVKMLTEEINNNAKQKNARQAAQNGPKIEGGVRKFNILLTQFNTLCKGVKEQRMKQQQQNQHSLSIDGSSRYETASSAFAPNTPPKVGKGPPKGNLNVIGGSSKDGGPPSNKQNAPAEQIQLNEKLEQLNTIYRQAKALGVEMHNAMLATIGQSLENTPKKNTS